MSHPVGKDGKEEVEDGETKQNLRTSENHIINFSLSPSLSFSVCLHVSHNLFLSLQKVAIYA